MKKVESASPEPKPKLREPEHDRGDHGRHSYTKLSYSCKTGDHGKCTAAKCECSCGHPV